MTRYLTHWTTGALLILSVAGTLALGLPATADSPLNNTTADMTNTEDGDNATLDIDCNASQVRVTAPDDYEYGLTVTVVNVTQSGTSTSTSSRTPLSGNATVEFADTGVVYAFVTDESTGDPVTSESARCSKLLEASAPNATDGPSIAIDCNESVIRFTAPEDVSYTAQVSSVDVSPTGSSTSTVSRTAEGNTTMSVDDELVIALASAESGDEPVSAVRDCSRTDGDEAERARESCSRDP